MSLLITMLKTVVRPFAARRVAFARFYSNIDKLDDSKDYNPGIKYPKEGSFVQSDTTPNFQTNRPIPLNVQALEYAPLRHPITHGDQVGEIVLASFLGTKDLELFADFLLRAAFYLGIPTKGPAPLPRKIKRWTVIRSPFVMAKNKENFERVTYRRVLKLYDANPETVEILLSVAKKYSIAGVGVKAKIYGSESIDNVEAMDIPTQSDLENPLAINKVHFEAVDGEVAQKVMELLKDPAFGLTEKTKKE